MDADNKNINEDLNDGVDVSSRHEKIGEMTISEGFKRMWHRIQELKLKHMMLVVGVCLAILFFSLLVYYVVPPAVEIIWHILKTCVSMPVGWHDSYYYAFLDEDLFCTIPLCLTVAAIVGRSFNKFKWMCGMIYCLLLVSMLEIWDYWFLEIGMGNEYLGGFCFAVMFVIIPVLIRVRNHTPQNMEETV